jgi:hypothetical protein
MLNATNAFTFVIGIFMNQMKLEIDTKLGSTSFYGVEIGRPVKGPVYE